MTKSPFTMPSVAFGLASFTATAPEIHPRTSRSCISCSKNMPDPKSSTSARSSPRGNPKTLRSPAERGRDHRSQQQAHKIANQHPAGEAPRRQDYPPRAAATKLVVGAGDGRSNRADFTACSTVKTARTQQGTARKRRPPEIGCLGRNQPTTQELSRTHINNPHNHTTTAPFRIHPTTHTNTTRRYKLYLPHSHRHTCNNQTSTTPTTPKHQNKKTSSISRIAESFT
jgi:hypothetical protein